MSEALTLMRLRPDSERIAAWAAAKRYLPDRGDDLGYALHAALAACLGASAPKPFYWRRRGESADLFGYSRFESNVLREAACLAGLDGALHAALNLGEIETQAMPMQWRAGRELAFEARIRPVVRILRERIDNGAKGRRKFIEMDAAVHAAHRVAAVEPQPKAAVYLSWAAQQMARSAEVIEAETVAMRRTSCLRRPRTEDGRKPAIVEGPDVTLKGHLRIKDGPAFAALLARGLGRHRAFGFGMILLAPPGAL